MSNKTSALAGQRQVRTRPSAWTTAVLAASFLLIFGLYNLPELFLDASDEIPTTWPLHLVDPEPLRYPGESLSWTPCGDAKGHPLECSTIHVPKDQYATATTAPDTADDRDTFSIPLIRLRGRNATKNILFNPGGPGGSGVQSLYTRGDNLHGLIGDGFHIIGFDPRGINGSRPSASCSPVSHKGDATQESNPLIHKGMRHSDFPEVQAWAANFAQACVDTMGDYAGYVNTPQVAADMNSILDAVGQYEMYYYGVSYGTVLGQTYAALFPERSQRIVIDGVVNTLQWYDSVLFGDSLTDTDELLGAFFDECHKAGPRNCSLASTGDSPQQIRDSVFELVGQLKEHPLSTYINNTHYGIITAEIVLLKATFNALYKPSRWPDLADRLSELMGGNGSQFLLDHVLVPDWPEAPTDIVMANDGLSGPKHWRQGIKGLEEELAPLWNSSVFADAHNSLYIPKQQWVVPRTHNFSLSHIQNGAAINGQGIETAHPLLILSTSLDPVTPLRSAEVAKTAFRGSEIVEVRGYGHCSLAEPSRCVIRAFRKYLYDGILPKGHTLCEAERPYFPKDDDRDEIPGNGSLGKVGAASENLDEINRAYLAQIALRRDWEWNRGI
ncbi:Alpha/Beta hydrolase protein [Microdochium trichocladiopsis]|uniref:Alpha/Beta hydrolase protein n=1 Tax=Microdochium trichocladiopsis TaxID=1682393 RepID=A0A9P8YCI0_9PEZI|nr:Alpha/Beta hydrolase protein [Microdochium trichocladiopsis]KAH7035856.1 Alpha/Beta hydrolase protein [Microdochium trichocladiopsis]